MVCPNYKKVFYFNNNKSKRKNCSKYKQPFKFTGSGRILSGSSKYNYDGSSYILLIHYSLPLNHDFTEPVFSHTSSASGMVNKMNHIPTLSSTGKCPVDEDFYSVKSGVCGYYVERSLEPESIIFN